MLTLLFTLKAGSSISPVRTTIRFTCRALRSRCRESCAFHCRRSPNGSDESLASEPSTNSLLKFLDLFRAKPNDSKPFYKPFLTFVFINISVIYQQNMIYLIPIKRFDIFFVSILADCGRSGHHWDGRQSWAQSVLGLVGIASLNDMDLCLNVNQRSLRLLRSTVL